MEATKCRDITGASEWRSASERVAIVSFMASLRRLRGPCCALIAALLCCAAASATAPLAAGARATARRAQIPSSLRLSAALWATIDVCNPPDQPYTVGIRGSMPSDGQPRDAMLMRFRLQYMDPALKRWIDLPGAASAYISVGSARAARQAGRSFVLYAPPAGGSYTLRGVVSFQWRSGGHLLGAITRASSTGHRSVSGADPANFSAAICRIH
jgi:hypothetical protein